MIRTARNRSWSSCLITSSRRSSSSRLAVSRLTRAEIRSLKKRDFVAAAEAAGVSRSAILGRHLLPNAMTPVLVEASLRFGEVILLEASLSYLGLGIQPPTPSWGNMIAAGASSLTSEWWVATFPGLALAATVVLFNFLADRLRDRLDPRGMAGARS